MRKKGKRKKTRLFLVVSKVTGLRGITAEIEIFNSLKWEGTPTKPKETNQQIRSKKKNGGKISHSNPQSKQRRTYFSI
jgi:cytoskeletal protein RodZ